MVFGCLVPQIQHRDQHLPLIHDQHLSQNSDPEKKLFVFNTALCARRSQGVSEKDAVVEMDRKKRGVLGVSTIAEELVTINKVRLCAHLSHTTPFGPLMYGSEA